MQRRVAALGLVLGTLAACSQRDALDATDALDAALTDALDAALTDAPADLLDFGDAPRASIHGRLVFDRYNNQRDIPGRNVALAIVGSALTTITDATGSYALEVPTGVRLLLRAQLDGEVSVQRVLTVPAGGAAVDLHVIDIDAWVGAVTRAHGDIDLFDHGGVVVRYRGSSAGGYGATLGASHGVSFVFDGSAGGIATASATTLAAGDSLYFATIAPGVTSVTPTAPAGRSPCVDNVAGVVTDYPVDVHTLTEIVLDCP